MDDFKIQISGAVLGKSISSDLKSQLRNIKDLSVNVDHVSLGQSAITDIKNTLLKNKIDLQVNLGTNTVKQQAQAIGQSVGTTIQKNITSALKPFSQLKIGTGNVDAILDTNGLVNFEKSLDKIKKIYSEFGQVRITDKLFDGDGNLKDFKVNIQQVNGDLKETRSFMMALNGTSFAFPSDIIKGSENYVHHLNEAKNITNATGDELNALNQRLAEQTKYYSKLKDEIKERYRLETKLATTSRKNESDEIQKQLNLAKKRITYNQQMISKKGLSDNSLEREKNDLDAILRKRLDIVNAKKKDKTDLTGLREEQELCNKLATAYSKIQSLEIKKSALGDSNDAAKITEINEQIEKYNISYKELLATVQNHDLNSSWKLLKSDIDAATQSQIAYNNARKTDEASAIQYKVDTGRYGVDFARVNVDYGKVSGSSNELSQKIDSLTKKYIALTAASEKFSESGDPQSLINAQESFQKELDTTKNKLKEITILGEKVDSIKNAAFSNKMEAWLQKNSAAAKDFGERIELMRKELEGANQITFNRVKAEFESLVNEARAAGKLGKSFSSSIKEAAASFSQWISVTSFIMMGIQQMKDMISTIVKLDTALVDLRKTTDATTSQLKDFYLNANGTAKRLGVTTEEIISQTAAWSRLGYSIKDASTLAENSAILKSISPDLNIEKATDGLVSSLKAFKLEADDSLDGIISKINIIGNTRAVDNGDIVDILSRSSSAMAEANNSLEQTIALGTAATEITRDAAEVGTALKTISMRIRGYDEETEEYVGNIENLSGEIADLTKTASTPGGISLFTDDSKETYKSTYQLLSDIQGIWNELTDKNQAKLLETLAGKRQGQVVSAMISNFSAAEDSMNSMANSAGNAMQEMDVIYDSIEYKLNALSQTGVGIAQNLFKQDDMKAVIDMLTSLAEALDFVTEKLGLFGSLSVIAGGILGAKGLGLTVSYSS